MKNVVLEIGKINFKGNVIDHGWYSHLKYDNGKANLNAIIILSDIVYWYKPTEVIDENKGFVGYKKKFKCDKLQKNYEAFANQFGLTKRQVKEACDFLKKKGVITVEFRTITTDTGMKLNNVMYVEPVIEGLKKISGYNTPYYIQKEEGTTKESNPYYIQKEEVLHHNGNPQTLKCKTNTENTTENILNNNKELNPIDLYQQNIFHSPGRLEIDALNSWSEQLGYELVILAISIAAKNNARRLEYIEKILMDWDTRGIKTIVQAEAYIKQRSEKFKKEANNNKSSSQNKKESTFNNFTNRDYDFNDLEKKLLGWE